MWGRIMHACSTGKLLTRAASTHHDGKGNNVLKHYGTLTLKLYSETNWHLCIRWFLGTMVQGGVSYGEQAMNMSRHQVVSLTLYDLHESYPNCV